MASRSLFARPLRNFCSNKRTFTAGKIIYNKQPGSDLKNVTGLSESVFRVPTEPVGPGAAKNTNYKNPEYFCYNQNSYYEAEVEMAKFRCPQPSVKIYYKPQSQ